MNWIQRKIYLYNVTFGLYMLDWWERFLFNTLVVVLMWFVCYNGFRYTSDLCKRWINLDHKVYSLLIGLVFVRIFLNQLQIHGLWYL